MIVIATLAPTAAKLCSQLQSQSLLLLLLLSLIIIIIILLIIVSPERRQLVALIVLIRWQVSASTHVHKSF